MSQCSLIHVKYEVLVAAAMEVMAFGHLIPCGIMDRYHCLAVPATLVIR